MLNQIQDSQFLYVQRTFVLSSHITVHTDYCMYRTSLNASCTLELIKCQLSALLKCLSNPFPPVQCTLQVTVLLHIPICTSFNCEFVCMYFCTIQVILYSAQPQAQWGGRTPVHPLYMHSLAPLEPEVDSNTLIKLTYIQIFSFLIN